MTELETFRRKKDRYFKAGPDSPILHEQRAEFAGLAYYPENAGLRLIVQPEEFDEKDAIHDDHQHRRRAGVCALGPFRLQCRSAAGDVTIYDASWGGFFVPFVDATSGSETYGAGRYLGLEALEDGRFWPISIWPITHTARIQNITTARCRRPNRIAVPVRAGECSIRSIKAVSSRQSAVIVAYLMLTVVSRLTYMPRSATGAARRQPHPANRADLVVIAVLRYLLGFHNPRVCDRVLVPQIEIHVALARMHAGKANLVHQVDRCFLWLHAECAEAVQRLQQPLVGRANDGILAGK